MTRITAITLLVTLGALTVAGQRRGPGGFRRGGPGGSGPGALEYPPVAKTEAEKRILNVLDEIVKSGDMFANVPASDGRMLRILTEAAGAKNVVEIGTSTGISGLWLCLALEKTGGRLQTFEIDRGRAASARANFKKAGVESIVNLVEGDAHDNIGRLKGPIDVIFIDADKEGYVDYLQKLAPLVRPGGLILAHNFDSAPDYVKAVSTDPNFETVLYREGGGLAVTLKKR